MTVYQARSRTLIAEGNEVLNFPNSVEIRVSFTPAAPFGAADGPSRTARLGSMTTMVYDGRTGRASVQSNPPLERVSLSHDLGDINFQFDGNTMVLRTYCADKERIGLLISWVESVVVPFLSIEFIDTPVVDEISGRVGGARFVMIYTVRESAFDSVTVDMQRDRLQQTLRRLEMRDSSRDRRITAALRYFLVACRLEQAGQTPWEFMGEVVLQLAKLLEVLFPAEANSTIEAARAGLAKLGYENGEVEKWLIPVVALRSHLDVAHVSLALLSSDQLEVLHTYTEAVRERFYLLLKRVIDCYDSGEFVVEPYESSSRKKDVDRIIRRLSENFTAD